ncbi:MAG: DUF2892 domain-containing protein [Bdellovibrionaceae bacterium]|nr:DUF2892 domain-containing protein [Pseudobdellovibrionaceae bacterium]
MIKNIKTWDRIFRVIAGIILLGWGVAGGPWWAYLGAILISTAAWGFCPLYWIVRR